MFASAEAASLLDAGLESWPGRVPAEILEPPAVDERGYVERDLAAELLDGYLRRLARQDALCRCVLGRLAGVVLKCEGHHRLGFTRLDDFSRERLGLSAR